MVTHLSLSLNNNSMMYVDHKHCASFGLACSLEFISQPSGEVVEFDFIYFFTWVYYLKRLQVIFHQETWDKNNILLDFDFIPQDLTGLWKKKQKKTWTLKHTMLTVLVCSESWRIYSWSVTWNDVFGSNMCSI